MLLKVGVCILMAHAGTLVIANLVVSMTLQWDGEPGSNHSLSLD